MAAHLPSPNGFLHLTGTLALVKLTVPKFPLHFLKFITVSE